MPIPLPRRRPDLEARAITLRVERVACDAPTPMKVYQRTLAFSTQGPGPLDITGDVAEIVRASEIATGLCTLFVRHTSASLLIQENADPAVLRDLGRWLAEIAPESSRWEHDDEGPDDMPSHLRAALLHTSETIPVTGGALALGTWQGIYLWEHRTRPHRRSVVVHVAGS